MSNGLLVDGELSTGVRFIDNPAEAGVLDFEDDSMDSGFFAGATGAFPSPNLTKVSIDFSRLPPSPFSTAKFLFSSANPISRSFAILASKSSFPYSPTAAPNTLDCLLRFGDGVFSFSASKSCRAAASRLDFDESGNIEEADLNPNLLPVFGGNGGGWSSEFVLPVLCLAGAFTDLSTYFCLMNLSNAESASSTSNGIGGFVFWGLYIRFDAVFPNRFMCCQLSEPLHVDWIFSSYLYLLIGPRVHTQ